MILTSAPLAINSELIIADIYTGQATKHMAIQQNYSLRYTIGQHMEIRNSLSSTISWTCMMSYVMLFPKYESDEGVRK